MKDLKQSILRGILLDFLIGSAIVAVLILLGRKNWQDYLLWMLLFSIGLWSKIRNLRQEKLRVRATLRWSDGQWEPVANFLAKPCAQREEHYGSAVTLRCYIYKIEKDGTIDTGFDVYIKTAEWTQGDPWAATTMRALHPGDYICVTGRVDAVYVGFMNIEAESIQKSLPVPDQAE